MSFASFDEPTMPLRTLSPLWGNGVTHRGNVRAANEDVLLLEPMLGLFGVFDGMGGAANGALAAALAANAVANFVRRTERPYSAVFLADALRYAASVVYETAHERPDCHGMGTTGVVCLADQNNIWIGHAGDSRAYLLRAGELQQLTMDHTLVQELVSSGEFTFEEAATRISGGVLTLNLGHDPDLVPTLVQLAPEPGDVLLLSSDGLHNEVPPEAIASILSQPLLPGVLALQLIEIALVGPCRDNVSALVLRYER